MELARSIIEALCIGVVDKPKLDSAFTISWVSSCELSAVTVYNVFWDVIYSENSHGEIKSISVDEGVGFNEESIMRDVSKVRETIDALDSVISDSIYMREALEEQVSALEGSEKLGESGSSGVHLGDKDVEKEDKGMLSKNVINRDEDGNVSITNKVLHAQADIDFMDGEVEGIVADVDSSDKEDEEVRADSDFAKKSTKAQAAKLKGLDEKIEFLKNERDKIIKDIKDRPDPWLFSRESMNSDKEYGDDPDTPEFPYEECSSRFHDYKCKGGCPHMASDDCPAECIDETNGYDEDGDAFDECFVGGYDCDDCLSCPYLFDECCPGVKALGAKPKSKPFGCFRNFKIFEGGKNKDGDYFCNNFDFPENDRSKPIKSAIIAGGVTAVVLGIGSLLIKSRRK